MRVTSAGFCAKCKHPLRDHHEEELSSHYALVCDRPGCDCIDGVPAVVHRIHDIARGF